MKYYRLFPLLTGLGMVVAVVGLGGMAYFAEQHKAISDTLGTAGYIGLYTAIVAGMLTMMFMPSDRR
ncbi:hypothetical protein [Magnetococcus marinus]|uniref:hypothetical protein n=1 Tax=Magnetococcus marinus TaxID=1124597 RepID=UPI0000381248|nr:hypothetical protein [Magnetococcus marinus]